MDASSGTSLYRKPGSFSCFISSFAFTNLCKQQEAVCATFHIVCERSEGLCKVTHAFICAVGAHSNHLRPKEGELEGQGGLAELCPALPEAKPEQMGALDESFVSWR